LFLLFVRARGLLERRLFLFFLGALRGRVSLHVLGLAELQLNGAAVVHELSSDHGLIVYDLGGRLLVVHDVDGSFALALTAFDDDVEQVFDGEPGEVVEFAFYAIFWVLVLVHGLVVALWEAFAVSLLELPERILEQQVGVLEAGDWLGAVEVGGLLEDAVVEGDFLVRDVFDHVRLQSGLGKQRAFVAKGRGH